MVKEATYDNPGSSFGILTLQLEIFSTIGINHSYAILLARYNKDFYQNEVELYKRHKKNKTTAPIGEQGNFFNLYFHMSQYLLQTAIHLSTGVCEAECNAIETQSEKKIKNKHFLKSVSKVPPIKTSTTFIIATCLTRQLV